ncbi:hypothetical protein DYB31_015180, partial [Aphanomyces astaci]
AVFEQHGAVELTTPLLMPKRASCALHVNRCALVDAAGVTVMLPFDFMHANQACTVASAAVAYYASPFLHGPWEFIASWDDSINFLDNTMIQQPLSISSIVSMFTTVKINVYEPLSWLLKALVHSVWGMDPFAVRTVTLVLHWVNCLVLYATSARLLRQLGQPHPLGCFIGTLLYAVHPIHVEVVGWPSAQPYALAMLFTLLCFYTHLHALECTSRHHRRFFSILSMGMPRDTSRLYATSFQR